VFLTKEEHDQFMDANEIFMQDNDERLLVEKEDYQTGLQNAIMQFQKQYNLRNKKVSANPPKGNLTKEAQNNIPSSIQPKKDSVAKNVVEKGKKRNLQRKYLKQEMRQLSKR
jgi:hypothetical protein